MNIVDERHDSSENHRILHQHLPALCPGWSGPGYPGAPGKPGDKIPSWIRFGIYIYRVVISVCMSVHNSEENLLQTLIGKLEVRTQEMFLPWLNSSKLGLTVLAKE